MSHYRADLLPLLPRRLFFTEPAAAAPTGADTVVGQSDDVLSFQMPKNSRKRTRQEMGEGDDDDDDDHDDHDVDDDDETSPPPRRRRKLNRDDDESEFF